MNNSNSTSFQKLLDEMREKAPYIKDVYYSEHIGNWTLQMSNGDSTEYSSFSELYKEYIMLDEQYLDHLKEEYERPPAGPLSLDYYSE